MVNKSRNCHLRFMTLIAFLLNAIIPFFAVYDISTAKASLVSPPHEKILICTARGFQWVTWEELQTSDSEQHSPPPQYQCALCYVAAHSTKDYLPVAPYMLPAPYFYTTQSFLAYNVADFKADFNAFSYHSRAPPVFS